MVHKKVIGRELYVYMNGSLLYKRWLDYDYGMVMCRQPFTAKDVESFRLTKPLVYKTKP